MREKCFGRCGGLALSRHSHLLPGALFSVLANNYLPSRFSGLITLLALHLARGHRHHTPKHFATTKRALPRFAIPSWLLVLQWLRDYFLHASALFVVSRLSGCHPWRFIQLQAVATYQTDATRTSCCGLHLYYASSPLPAVSLSCGESCVFGSRLPARQLRFVH